MTTGSSSTDQRDPTLQSKYSRLVSSLSSKIPVKDRKRQVSTPIQPLDESQLGSRVRKSSIPRITSSPITPVTNTSASSSPRQLAVSSVRRSSRRTSLSPLVNVVNTSHVQSTPNNKGFTTAETPPSTVTKLAMQLSTLNISTPSPSPSKSRVPFKSITTTPSQIQTAMDRKKTRRTPIKSEKPSPRQQEPKLENRTSALLKSRVQSASTTNPPKSSSPAKRAVTRKASTQAMPSPVKRIASKSKLQPPVRTASTSTPTDDSPLIARLTRSTTASDLKATAVNRRSSRIVSETSATSAATSQSTATNIPRTKNIPKRVVSEKPELMRTTRSMKRDMTMMGLTSKAQSIPEAPSKDITPRLKTAPKLKPATQDPQLELPKRRLMTKSFTVNVGLKDLQQSNIKPSNVPSRQPVVKRTPSTKSRPNSTIIHRRNLSTSRSATPTPPPNLKCKTPESLYKLLTEHNGTKKVADGWADNTRTLSPTESRSPDEVIKSGGLNTFEKQEVLKRSKVYYLGNVGQKHVDPSNFGLNFGYDDKDNNLIVNNDDHISYRYQILCKLGTGMFGKVYKCRDHKKNTIVSVKIMRNDPVWSLQSIQEIKILKQLQHENLLSYIEYFNFRSHICITTELLAVTMLEALEATKFKGFDIEVIKLWSKQLLAGLSFLHNYDIIHGDLKPENIMLKTPHSFDLKIIDFGSSATVGNVTFPYIQSRFYRAPEVLLGCRYDTKIDIWSFSTLIYEMYTGSPMFEAQDEEDLYKLIVKLIGQPSPRAVVSLRNELFKEGSINKYQDPKFIDKNTMIFTKFDRLGSYKHSPPLEQMRRDWPMYRKLKLDHAGFANFLGRSLVWNHHERPDAQTLLADEFLK